MVIDELLGVLSHYQSSIVCLGLYLDAILMSPQVRLNGADYLSPTPRSNRIVSFARLRLLLTVQIVLGTFGLRKRAHKLGQPS